MRNWQHLVHWLFDQASPPAPVVVEQPVVLDPLLAQYEQMLRLPPDATHLLESLLARDAIAAALQQPSVPSAMQIQKLAELDAGLRSRLAGLDPEVVDEWRQTLGRPASAWWFATAQAESRAQRQELPWVLLSGAFIAMTTALTLDIIKRLWDGTPDTISIIGTLLTLLLTASPLTKQGQAVGQALIQQITWITPRWRRRAAAGVSVLAFAMVFVARLLLPQLANVYNNWGVEALQNGHLAAALQDFRRAVALTPDLVVPYQNVANSYQQIGLYDQAISWYQQALEHDRDFGPAYRGLGHVFNQQGQFAKAVPVLLAGLALPTDSQSPELQQLELVTRYALLADLGWAYFEQQRFARAQEVLTEAITVEQAVRTIGEQSGQEFRAALPHYYLARIYDTQGQTQDALQQWKDTLRFLRPSDWADREWLAEAQRRLQELEQPKP
jgi:tetratricopeptide (TPR) repeat protein